MHEAGHSFHVFAANHLPYEQQKEVPMEFAEVASMGMELLATPAPGGFLRQRDAARALIDHLEGLILFWPYMAVVDAFQHWAYLNPAQASEPAQCDAAWSRLRARFMKGVDYAAWMTP